MDTVSVYFEGGRRPTPVYRVQGASARFMPSWGAGVLCCAHQQRAHPSLQNCGDDIDLKPECPVDGPAIVLDQYTTVVVEPAATVHGANQPVAAGPPALTVAVAQPTPATVLRLPPQAMLTSDGNVLLELTDTAAGRKKTDLDPIQLSIFGHRFMRCAVRPAAPRAKGLRGRLTHGPLRPIAPAHGCPARGG